jgi:hypothetical protein
MQVSSRFRLLQSIHSVVFDREASWLLAALPRHPHRKVGGLDVAAETLRVEERIGQSIALKLSTNGSMVRLISAST